MCRRFSHSDISLVILHCGHSEQDNLYMKTQSQLCGVSSLILYEHIFRTHHHLLVNLISLQLLLVLCSYGHYSSGGIE